MSDEHFKISRVKAKRRKYQISTYNFETLLTQDSILPIFRKQQVLVYQIRDKKVQF